MPTRGSRGIRSYGEWRIDERVILLSSRWCEPRIADQTLHLLRRSAVGRVGSGYYVLLDHQRAKVVAAESQGDLPDLHPHCHPARLEIGDVVEDDAREGDGTEVLGRASFWLARHRRRVLGLQRPADECRESARARLHVPDSLQVFQALGKRLAQTVHHRNGRLHPFIVRELHNLEPPVSAGFLGRDDVSNALHENLSPSAWDRVEARLPQLSNHFDRIHPEQLGEEIDLARTEPVNVDRVIALDVAHQIEVPLERDVGIVPALDQYLNPAKRLELLDLGADLLE